MRIDLPRPLRWLVVALFRNLGFKVFALGLTVLLFVVTRDEVTRHFEVPLRVVADPMRVPLTPLPETVKVAVRGPWTRVNRLQPYDLGNATLDLRHAEPGPLTIDRASIVMPPGVVLSGLYYDEVDLRFDPIVRAVVPVEAQVVGAVDPDHRLIATEVEPDTWTIEGGASAAQTVSRLLTEAVHVGGARTSLEREVAIVPPDANVRLLNKRGGTQTVRVTVRIEPWNDRRTMKVPLPFSAEAVEGVLIPPAYDIVVSGPRPGFRQLDALALDAVFKAQVVGTPSPTDPGTRAVEIQFDWHPQVPSEIRELLSFKPQQVLLRVPSLL